MGNGNFWKLFTYFNFWHEFGFLLINEMFYDFNKKKIIVQDCYEFALYS